MSVISWFSSKLKSLMLNNYLWSIKNLTLSGFILVALPLVIALLFSVSQVNQLSRASAEAIFNVEKLINTNQEISDTLINMERYLSQYKVLSDQSLLQAYQQQESFLLTNLIPYLSHYDDQQLQILSEEFLQTTSVLEHALDEQETLNLSLDNIQYTFKKLAKINQKINLRSKQLLTLYASEIQRSASYISDTIISSLFIIPITLLIAGVFIFLIVKPLKNLLSHIQRLQQGHFSTAIKVQGSAEIREITQALDLMRTRLHALELQKSSFIRHISHELKTPLAAIREGTELIYDHSVGQLNDEQQEICNIIKDSVKKLQRLIEDLLDFNVVLDSTSLQDSEKLDVVLLLDQVLLQRTLDIKRKKLVINKNIEAITLHSNAKQVITIFDNILSNAIKYAPENSEITINANLVQQQLHVQIIDRGKGISAALQEKVFDAFYQGPAPEDNQIKGSGLGLTIVKELLMRLNGKISLTSPVSAQQGTAIDIYLPRAQHTINKVI